MGLKLLSSVALLLVFSGILSGFVHANSSQSNPIAARLERELLRLNQPLDGSLLENARRFHYVLITGMGNEFVPTSRGAEVEQSYLGMLAWTLRTEIGASATIINPPTMVPPLENARRLVQRLTELRNEISEPKPFILLGHSKGGLEAVAMATERPDLLASGWIAQVVAVNAPLQGSPVADALWGLARLLPTQLRELGEQMSSRWNVAMFRRRIERLTSEERDLLDRSIYYVRSYEDPVLAGKMSWRYWAFDPVLKGKLEKHDGIVPLESQRIPGFGVDLGAVTCEHCALVIGDRPEKDQYPRAFARAIVSELHDSRQDCGRALRTRHSLRSL